MTTPKRPTLPSLSRTAPAAATALATKTFSVAPWTGAAEGEKIVVYGPSGIGKTSLAAMAPDPIFIGIDDGGRKIRRPDGSPIPAVQGVETFADLRAALATADLWKNAKSVVLDTFTKVETALCIPHVLATVRTEKGGTVQSIKGFGWGSGEVHILEHMRLILMDLDRLVRMGKHVVLLCQEQQSKVANAEGIDYVQDGPKLQHANNASVRLETIEWADHVVRVGFLDTQVAAAAAAKVGKLVSRDTTRVLYTAGARHFIAKSRTIKEEMISYETEADDSFWRIIGDQ